MKTFQFALIILVSGFVLSSAQAGKWDRKKMTAEQITFCDTYLAPVLNLQKTEGNEAALELLEKNYRIAEKKFSNSYFFYSAVWWQAQTQSGDLNPEWGLAIYEYLQKRKHVDPESGIHIPWGDYLLISNVIGKNNDLGRAAQARAVTMNLEDNMKSTKGMDTTCASYTDLGPIFNFMPDARKRDIPIYEHELPNKFRETASKTKKDYINYAYVYGVGYAAESAQMIGDWIHATELHYWVISFTDEYAKENNFRRGELIRHARDAYKSIADIAILNGYPEEASAFMQEYIDKNSGIYKTNDVNLYDGLLKMSTIRILLNTLSEEDLRIARKAEELHYNWTYSGRDTKLDATLKRIQIQHALGYTEEAWSDLNDFLRQAETDPNPHLEMLGINTAINLALADGGTHPELELWLVRALDHERLMGNKFNELPLYEKYAQFLIIHGRFDEAEQIQAEAIRLADAMNLPKRVEQNRTVLSAMTRLRKERTVVADEKKDAPENILQTPEETAQTASTDRSQTKTIGTIDRSSKVDLQPRSSLSVTLNGQSALGRSYLYNPSARPETGTLQLAGPLDNLNWQTENWLTAQSYPDIGSATFEKEITLQPGASCIIDITGMPLTDGTDTEITCSWKSADHKTISSQWTYRKGTSDKRTAVIDAHTFQSNPFFLIPIHHTVQRTDTSGIESTDFAIEATTPTRIEIYAGNGDLLAIDANGDGDFMDGGDFIAVDRNRNSWPDITFEKGASLTSLIMYIKPLAESPADSQLAVKLLRNDEWMIDAIDEIRTK